MSNGQCPKCGAPRNHGPDCQACGVIYAKAEQQAYHEKRNSIIRGETSRESLLRPCPVCKKEISKIAPSCPHCGEPFSHQPIGQSYNALAGVAGAALLAIGVFCPLVSVPIMGSLNYFMNGKGDGVVVLFFAAASVGIVLWKKFRLLLVTGGATAVLMIFSFTQFHHKMGLAQADMERSMTGNPFGGLAKAAMQSIQMQWGWAVLVLGVALLIFAGAKKSL